MSNEQQPKHTEHDANGNFEQDGRIFNDLVLRVSKADSLKTTEPRGMVVPGDSIVARPGYTPVKPQGGLSPFARDLDGMVEATDDEPIPGEETAASVNYRTELFPGRETGKFADSFDFVYDRYGNVIAAVIPEEDALRDAEREDRAGKFAESFVRGLEKKIGSKIEQADTSHLHNNVPIMQRAKEFFAPQKRRVIHDDDEV